MAGGFCGHWHAGEGIVRKPTVVVNMRGTRDNPKHDVRIDRRSRWGNPHYLENPHDDDERRACIRAYARWLAHADQSWILEDIDQLRGQRLGCWCAPRVCHGHVLALLADRVCDDPIAAGEVALEIHGI